MAEAQRPNRRRPPAPASPYPWLLCVQGKEKKKKQLFFDVFHGSKREKSVPELEYPVYPMSSKFGWVVLMKNYDPKQSCLTGNEGYHLWNPVTLESIPLPPLQLEGREYIIGMQLTSVPDSPDSVFVMFVDRPRGIFFCRLKDGDLKWIRKDCSKEITDWHVYYKTVVCNEKIYSFQKRPRLVWEIEIEKAQPHSVSLEPIEFTEPKLPDNCREYWAESDGEIYSLRLELGHGEVMWNVVVLKLNLDDDSLREITNFPDKVFFADPSMAFCCPAHSESMGNKVFFTLSGTNVLYTYDVEDGSISSTIPFPGVPYDVLHPIEWVLPSLPPSLMIAKKEDVKPLTSSENVGRNQEEQAKNVSQLEELPEGVIDRILKCLDPFEYLSFRTLSRRCRSVAPKKECRLLENNVSSPWLILPVIHKRVISMVDATFGGESKCCVTVPAELPENARIHYSKNGWLLMSSAGDPSVKLLFVYNPLTSEVIQLPELEMKDYRDTNDFFFLSTPKWTDFTVVAMNYLVVFAVIIPAFVNVWKVFDVPLVGYRLSALHSNHVWTGDTIYYLSDRGNLHVVRVKEPGSFYLTAVEVNIPSRMSYKQSYLVICDGRVLAVHVGEAGKRIRVFKLNGSGLEWDWEEVKDLGNNCLYLSKLSTFAVDVGIRGFKNRIYFARFFGESMVYYSMETGKLHYSLPREGNMVEETLNDFHGTKEHLSSCWYEPKWKAQDVPSDPETWSMIDRLGHRLGLSLADENGINFSLLDRDLSRHHLLP